MSGGFQPGNRGNANGQQQQNQQQQQQETNKQRTFDSGFGVTNAFGIENTFGGRNRGGEVFQTTLKAAQEIARLENERKVPQDVDKIEYTVIPVMKDSFGLHYSSIVICAKFNGIVKHNVLLIESTGGTPYPIEVTLEGGVNISLPLYPSQVLDEVYMNAVNRIVASTTGVDVNDVYDTDGVLVPTEFSVNDEHRLEEFLEDCFVAVKTSLISITRGYIGTSFKDMLAVAKGGFTIDVRFNHPDHMLYNSLGMPIRQDIEISLTFENNQRQNNGPNSSDPVTKILTVSGYVTPMKTPERNNRRYDRYEDDRYPFVPNFIITNIRAPGRIAMTEHLMMMGVLLIYTISEDRSWMRTFVNHGTTKGKPNYNDAALLNIEGRVNAKQGKYGEPYPLYGPSKDSLETRIDEFFQMVMSPDLAISMDIAEAGPETWYTSIFKAIQEKDPIATSRMRDVITTLLGGRFDDRGLPMFIDLSNDIHGGYYKEADGTLSDIRKVDSYLGIAWHAEDRKDYGMLSAYTRTLIYDRPDADIRAYNRMQMIQNHILHGGAVTKQMYKRVTFYGEYLDNLMPQAREAHFRPFNKSLNSEATMFSGGGYDYSSIGINSNLRFSEERRHHRRSSGSSHTRRWQ